MICCAIEINSIHFFASIVYVMINHFLWVQRSEKFQNLVGVKNQMLMDSSPDFSDNF